MVSDFRPDESYQFFLQEVPELLRILEEGFLELHQNTEVEHLWNLMCTTHSIKGGAACAGIDAIQTYAHHLETFLKRLTENTLPVSIALEELLLQALDYLKAAVVEEVKGGESATVLVQAQAVMDELRKQLPSDGLERKERDVVYALFEEDVKKGLRRLKRLLADKTAASRLEVFKTQVEILQGIGEITNLPGFIEIATTTLDALHRLPQQLDTVGSLALTDFTVAYTLVLEGDRVTGGKPSHDLKALVYGQSSHDGAQIPQPSSILQDGMSDNLSSEHQASTQVPSIPPILLSTSNDTQQWQTINSLVGEMVTLDSRLMAQQIQAKESLVIGERSFLRLKQLMSRLSGRYNLSAHVSDRNFIVDSYQRRIQQQKDKRLQKDLQDVTEEISQLREFFKDFDLLFQQQNHLLKQHQKQLKQAQDHLLHAQMVPISGLLKQFPRMVRQLAQKQNKSVRLDIVGDSTLVDKTILEKLYEPLLHLIRNAIDHGIESVDVRQACQKSIPAAITVRAKHHGYNTYIEVEDDGQGIDFQAIRSMVLAQGWLTTDEVTSLPNQHLYDYLFQPNFSTTSEVSQSSGRGVGLYAVRTQIQDCQGTVRVSSKPGIGTRFTLRLPFNTTVTKLLLFRSQQQLYALSVDSVVALTYATPQYLTSRQDQAYYLWNQREIPLYTLFHLLTYRYPLPSVSREALDWLPPNAVQKFDLGNTSESFPVLLVGEEEDPIAFRVDEILKQHELVVKPLENDFIHIPDYLQGSVTLGDGQLLPVLNSAVLVERCLQLRYPQLPKLQAARSSLDSSTLPTVMIVDDSLTIRSVLALTLHKNGYHVIQAKDGQDALPLVTQNSNLAAIICDIEMPHMSGLELLNRCRRQGIKVPFIMLTYRSSERYRLLAEQLGASAYVTKPYLDKELLQVLRNCLES